MFLFTVTSVDSGSKALEFLGLYEEDHELSDAKFPHVSPTNQHQDMEVNLIITDYFMPGMTGYDLLRKIKVILFFLIFNKFCLKSCIKVTKKLICLVYILCAEI